MRTSVSIKVDGGVVPSCCCPEEGLNLCGRPLQKVFVPRTDKVSCPAPALICPRLSVEAHGQASVREFGLIGGNEVNMVCDNTVRFAALGPCVLESSERQQLAADEHFWLLSLAEVCHGAWVALAFEVCEAIEGP